MPILVTIIFPPPSSTIVPIYAILSLSASGVSSSNIFVCFDAGIHSPVRTTSFILRLLLSITLPSAGTLSPSSKNTISPGTIFSAFISIFLLSLRTIAFKLNTLFNFAKALDDLFS